MRRSRTRRAQQQPRRVKFLVGYWLLGALCTAKPEPTPTLRAVELSIQALCVCGCGFSASFLSRPGAVVSNIRQRLRKWSTLDLAKCSPSRHHFSAPAKWQNLEPGLQAGRSCPAPQVRSPPARGGCSADAVETADMLDQHSRSRTFAAALQMSRVIVVPASPTSRPPHPSHCVSFGGAHLFRYLDARLIFQRILGRNNSQPCVCTQVLSTWNPKMPSCRLNGIFPRVQGASG